MTEPLLVIVDSREKPQAIRNILAYFDRHGIAYEKRALKTGDYTLEGHGDVVVDRKQSLQELAHNLLSPDRARFYREIRRAQESGIRLIILCEQAGIKTFADVKNWKPKFGKVSGKALMDAIFRLEVGYHVPVLFCDKRSTGRQIIEILTGEGYEERPDAGDRPDQG